MKRAHDVTRRFNLNAGGGGWIEMRLSGKKRNCLSGMDGGGSRGPLRVLFSISLEKEISPGGTDISRVDLKDHFSL